MSLDTTIDVSGNLQAALGALKPEAMMQAAKRGLDRGMLRLASEVTAKRLTGKGPFPVAAHQLGVKTGRLRQSLRTTPAKLNGMEVVATMGTKVGYAAAHEFGFTGTVKVEAHQRTLKRRGGKRLPKAMRRNIPVKAHQRKVVIPERAPIRTGIKEDLAILEQEMAREVTTAMGGTATP